MKKILYQLFKPTNNKKIQFFRYTIVGIMSTIVDCIALYISKKLLSNLTICVGIGLIFGFIVTFIGTRKIVFYTPQKMRKLELIVIISITIIGILMTEILMNLFTYTLNIYFMISKAIVTLIVMLYNFATKRIFYNYYNKNKKEF